MAIYKTFEVALELKQTSTNPSFSVIEGDTGNKIKISVTDGGSAVDLTGCRVIAVFSKTNGISMQDSGSDEGGISIGGTNNNEITIDVFPGSIAPGNVECELQIYSGESYAVLITTARYNFTCRRAAMNEDVLMSTNEYPLLVDLIATVEGFTVDEAKREAAEAIRKSNEDTRKSNEADREAAEDLRDAAEDLRVAAETTRASSEQERVAAETSRASAETARSGAETERTTAEAGRTTAEAGRVTAETGRVAAEQSRASAETERKAAEGLRDAEYDKWVGANASATTLAAGSDATVTVTEVGGVKHFAFGVPKGTDGLGTGDMSKSTYDTDSDGIVDNSEKLEGHTAAYFATADHTHDYAAPAKLRTATLGVAEWSGAEAPFTQTVAVEGVLEDPLLQAIHISPAPGYGTMWGTSGVECTEQGENSLTFTCETAPENDITVNIVIQEAQA